MLLGILLTLLVFVCVLLIAVILMQRSEGGALGMGGGGGGFLSARGTGDLLTKTTQVLGFIFFLLCLAITVITGRSEGSGSLINQAPVGQLKQLPRSLPAAPSQAPAAPAQQPDGFQAPLPSGLPTSPPSGSAPVTPSPFQAPPAK